jgi:DNA gyrase/topoisomerase IV subunit A
LVMTRMEALEKNDYLYNNDHATLTGHGLDIAKLKEQVATAGKFPVSQLIAMVATVLSIIAVAGTVVIGPINENVAQQYDLIQENRNAILEMVTGAQAGEEKINENALRIRDLELEISKNRETINLFRTEITALKTQFVEVRAEIEENENDAAEHTDAIIERLDREVEILMQWIDLLNRNSILPGGGAESGVKPGNKVE